MQTASFWEPFTCRKQMNITNITEYYCITVCKELNDDGEMDAVFSALIFCHFLISKKLFLLGMICFRGPFNNNSNKYTSLVVRFCNKNEGAFHSH